MIGQVKKPTVLKQATHKESQEIPVSMGGIDFMLDVSLATLVQDTKGRETLQVNVAVRGVGTNGVPLEIGSERTLYAS
jgi:hypothetical protein